MLRHPALQRIRKPTLVPDYPEKDAGVSREPTTATIAPLEEEEETAEINEEQAEVDNDEFRCEPCEVEPLRTAPNPILPSAADVEEHRLTHWPFRSWCKFCNLGRGTGEQHRRDAEKQRSIAIVGIDYWYITSSIMKKRSELEQAEDSEGEVQLTAAREDGSIIKCIVVRCHQSKNTFAHFIPCKGADEDKYVANLLVTDISWMGHTRLILKSDQEVSLLALVTQILQVMKFKVEGLESLTTEQSAAYESQSNGATEVAVRAIRGLMRTLRLCLEARVGQKVPDSHPLMAWLLEHTAHLLNVTVRGDDGLTPWARVRGRAFNQRLFGYGESVIAKLPSKGPQHDVEGNMGPRQQIGVFVGYC